jgi:hydrogenase maturation protein HypF
LKNSFALARGGYIFLSHHIGDLENYETLRDYEQGIAHYEKLFRIFPEFLAYDLHPDYLSTRYALARAESSGLPATGIQHHHAHIAACMAEHGVPSDEPVVGLSFDGTGYGSDGAIWGGEVLLAHYTGFSRLAHLKYTPLPGGDAAVRRPARTALAHLWAAGISWEPELACTRHFCAEDLVALKAQLTHQLNAPSTSSMGRLFDAAAAIAGVRQTVNYEAQAAIEFEALADPGEKSRYPFDLPDLGGSSPALLDPGPLIQALSNDALRGVSIPRLSARFHNTLAELAAGCATAACRQTDASRVVLSGGVWQNDTLLRKTLSLLNTAEVTVLIHQQAPANDGGIALGQAAVLAHILASANY